jgi:autotransporter-associated beta strand protein
VVFLNSHSTFTGQTSIDGGTLVINGSTSSRTIIAQAGTLSGNGTIHEDVVNSGNVLPGDFANPGGTLTIDGDYQQLATGQLGIHILSRTESNELNVGGLFNLSGSLRLTLEEGVELMAADSFQIFDFGTLSGTFATINAPTLEEGLNWDFSKLYTDGVIVVVPEPRASILALLGITTLAGVLRRRPY